MMKHAFQSLAATVMLASGAAASASSAIGLITPGEIYSGSQYTLGFEFSALNHQVVTSLGAYDEDSDGLAGRAFVGLWDTDGNLLTSVTIGAGTSGTLDGTFRYATIAPFALTVGKHYIVGAFEPGDNATSWATGQGGTAALNANLNYYGDRYSNFDSAFSFPSETSGTNGAWLGGNFIIEGGAVPEPASWALMLTGFSALGVAMRRRRWPVSLAARP